MIHQAVAVATSAVLIGWAVTASARADGVCRVQDVEYHGWRCKSLSNGRIEVLVAPQLGGRIIQLRLGDTEYLWVNPKLTGKVVSYATGKVADPGDQAKDSPQWANYGGDKLWPAPQGSDRSDQWPGPPDPVAKGGTVDNGAYACEAPASGTVEAAVRLTSPRDLYAGIRFIREIRVRPRTTTVELTATMVNVIDKPVRWGIWQVTQHAGHVGRRGRTPHWRRDRIDVKAWSPLNPSSKYPQGYRVMFGPKDNPQFAVDRSLTELGGVALFRLDYSYRVGKVGSDNAAGWLAVTHQKSGHLYAHTFPPMADRDHPDGASVEFWASGVGEIKLADKTVTMSADEPILIESEVLSPFAKLEPGDRYSYATRLHLAHGVGPVVNVTDAGAQLTPLYRCPIHGCMGKLAVFHDGELQTVDVSGREPVGIGKVRAGQSITVERLAGAAKVRNVTELRLVDTDGKLVGKWPTR